MCRSRENNGKLVIVSGPSGVGKTTICRDVAEKTGAFLSVSMTTRPKAEKEIDGAEYRFVSRDEFQEQIEQGRFLEYAEVFGNLYGTPREPVDKALKEGRIVILQIDVQGARQVKEIYPGAIMIFILPPDQKELAHRMAERGRDMAEVAQRRLDGASNEIAAAWQYYESMVINDELEQAVREVVQIINDSTTEKKE
jgi:guanylate kinase